MGRRVRFEPAARPTPLPPPYDVRHLHGRHNGRGLPAQGCLACEGDDEVFYRYDRFELRIDANARPIDWAVGAVVLRDGDGVGYHRLLMATGAVPRRLTVPGSTLEGVHVLRTAADALNV